VVWRLLNEPEQHKVNEENVNNYGKYGHDLAAAQHEPSQPLFSQAPSIGLKFLSDYGLRQN
jgi:hypothetical protein